MTRLWAYALAGVVACFVPVTSEPAAATTMTPSVLHAGQRLVAKTLNDSLFSPSGEFQLSVHPDMLTLDQQARMTGPSGPDFAGTGIWFRDDGTGLHQSNTDHSVLELRRNGNLVLTTSSGVVLWTSNTAGTGSDNRLVL